VRKRDKKLETKLEANSPKRLSLRDQLKTTKCKTENFSLEIKTPKFRGECPSLRNQLSSNKNEMPPQMKKRKIDGSNKVLGF